MTLKGERRLTGAWCWPKEPDEKNQNFSYRVKGLLMTVAIIVQARMGSTRLPGKIMKNVLGKTLLEYLLERLKRVTKADAVCIATTTGPQEQSILDICNRMSVKTFRGSEEDVLDRYFRAAQQLKAEVIVRVTSDCPLIDPIEIDKLIGYYLENLGTYDYIADIPQRSYPRGMGAEIFSFEALTMAHQDAKTPPEREHVTPHLYWNPQKFRIGHFTFEEDQKDHRWTVDTSEDLELISKIIENLYPQNRNFAIWDILELFKENPEWKYINSCVKQKALGE